MNIYYAISWYHTASHFSRYSVCIAGHQSFWVPCSKFTVYKLTLIFSVDVRMELTPSATYVHLRLTPHFCGSQKWMPHEFN